MMPEIRPVSDLRNYNDVLKHCSVGNPVYLTKNGRGKYVVMVLEEYEGIDRRDAFIESNSESNSESGSELGSELGSEVNLNLVDA